MLLLEDKLSKIMSSIRVPEEFNEDCSVYGINCPYRYENGASKAVLIMEDIAEVIKIPFELGWENDPLEGASCSGIYSSDWDYCNTEVEMYDILCEEGLEQFFAETKFWGYDKNMHPLYTQEKVIEFYEGKEDKTPSKKSLEKSKKLGVERLDYDWIALAIDWYGEKEVERLISFLRRNDYCIGYDLHCNNVGFRANGAPVILDYSGYWDN